MRSAARRNEVANYCLETIITEDGDKSSTSGDSYYSSDALVEGIYYNATGNIPCTMAAEQPGTRILELGSEAHILKLINAS